MRNKLKYLTGVSLKRKIDTKWFKVVNILLAIVIVGVMNIDSIIKSFGGDFSAKQQIYVIDNTGVSYDTFKNQMMATSDVKKEADLDYVIKKYKGDEASAKAFVKKHTDYLVVEFNNDDANIISVKLISQGYLDILDNQFLTSSIYNTKVMLATAKSGISAEKLNSIYASVNVKRIILDQSKSSEDENMNVIMSTVFPVVILPFFMLVIFLVQMIGAEINDEKTTKGMEIIISSVSPTTHFFSKIIASNLFVIIQGLLFFLYGGLGLLVRGMVGGSSATNGMFKEIGSMLSKVLDSSFIDKLIYIIPITLVLMLLTFLAYSLLAGILASMTTNIEDFQQVQTPIVIVLLIGYYLAMLAGTFKGAAFIKVLSFVPFISAILSPSLLVLGQIGLVDVCISVVLMIVTVFLLIKYGLKVYKVGILNYSSNKIWKKIFKAIKE